MTKAKSKGDEYKVAAVMNEATKRGVWRLRSYEMPEAVMKVCVEMGLGHREVTEVAFELFRRMTKEFGRGSAMQVDVAIELWRGLREGAAKT